MDKLLQLLREDQATNEILDHIRNTPYLSFMSDRIIELAIGRDRYDFVEKFKQSGLCWEQSDRYELLRTLASFHRTALYHFGWNYNNISSVTLNQLLTLDAILQQHIVNNGFFQKDLEFVYMTLCKAACDFETFTNVKKVADEVPTKYMSSHVKVLILLYDSVFERLPLPKDLINLMKRYV